MHSLRPAPNFQLWLLALLTHHETTLCLTWGLLRKFAQDRTTATAELRVHFEAEYLTIFLLLACPLVYTPLMKPGPFSFFVHPFTQLQKLAVGLQCGADLTATRRLSHSLR